MEGPRSTWGLWLCAALLPALWYVSQTMCVWQSPRALGELSVTLLTVSVVLMLPLLASPFVVIYYLINAVLDRKDPALRNAELSAAGVWICYAILCMAAIKYGNHTRYSTFARATHPGAEIIDALCKYQQAEGHYPEALEELVPKYLDVIPYTGLIGYPDFRYEKDRNDLDVVPGQYELRIHCTSGGINFDRFIYWPSQDYPRRIQDNGISHIGAWAYVHE